MSEEEEIGAARAELRKQLLLDLTSRDLKHAVLAYLNRLPKKSVSKEHLIADLLAAIAQSRPFLEQKRFIERLIEDVPLELLGVTELATLRLVQKLAGGLRGTRSKPPRATTPEQRRDRIRRRKRLYDWSRRGREHRDPVGMIERDFSGDPLPASADLSEIASHFLAYEKAHTCLDGLFSGAAVKMATGLNSLQELFGVGRKSLPKSLPCQRVGKARAYGYPALLICMQARLRRGRWLKDSDRRTTVVSNVIQRAHRVAAPEVAAAVERALGGFIAA